MFLFGAVRLWSIGPLAGLIFVALFLFFVRPSSLEIRGLRLPVVPFVPVAVLLLYLAVHAFVFSRIPHESQVQLLMILAAAGGLFLWIQLGGSPRRFRLFLGAALILVTLVCWYAFIQHARGIPIRVWIYDGLYGERVSGSYICPNHFASLAGLGLVTAFALLLTPEAGAVLKVIAGYALLVIPYPLILSQSRAGLLGAAAGVAAVLLLQAWRRNLRLFAYACVAVPLLAGGAGWAAWSLSPGLRERFHTAVREGMAGKDWRVQTYAAALHIVESRPAWGYGGGSYRWVEPTFATQGGSVPAVYAHNEPLQFAAEHGLAGAGLALAALGVAGFWTMGRIRRARSARAAGLLIAAAGATVAHGVHGLFDFNWHIYANSSLLLLVIGLALAACYEDGDLKPWLPSRRVIRLSAVAGSLAAAALLAVLVPVLASYFLVLAAQRSEASDPPDWKRAAELYRAAVKLDASSWRAHLGLADIGAATAAFVEGSGEEARRHFERAGAENPFHPDIPFGLSRLESQAGRLETALEHLRRAVELTPGQGWYLGRMGILLRKLGQDREAFKVLENSLKLDPGDWQARAHYRQLQKKLAPSWTVFPEYKDPPPDHTRRDGIQFDSW